MKNSLTANKSTIAGTAVTLLHVLFQIQLFQIYPGMHFKAADKDFGSSRPAWYISHSSKISKN